MKFITTFLAAILFSSMASAIPITLTYTGTLPTGTTLDGAEVADLPFVFIANGDSDNVVGDPGFLTLPHDTATIMINGGPALAILSATETFSLPTTGLVGLSVLDSPISIDAFVDFQVSGFDFTTNVDQVTEPEVAFLGAPFVLQTTGGDLNVQSIGINEGTFEATLSPSDSVVVPLPPTLLLSLAGLGLLHLTARAKRRAG